MKRYSKTLGIVPVIHDRIKRTHSLVISVAMKANRVLHQWPTTEWVHCKVSWGEENSDWNWRERKEMVERHVQTNWDFWNYGSLWGCRCSSRLNSKQLCEIIKSSEIQVTLIYSNSVHWWNAKPHIEEEASLKHVLSFYLEPGTRVREFSFGSHDLQSKHHICIYREERRGSKTIKHYFWAKNLWDQRPTERLTHIDWEAWTLLIAQH